MGEVIVWNRPLVDRQLESQDPAVAADVRAALVELCEHVAAGTAPPWAVEGRARLEGRCVARLPHDWWHVVERNVSPLQCDVVRYVSMLQRHVGD